MGGMPVTAGGTLGAAVTCGRFPPCLWVLGVRGGRTVPLWPGQSPACRGHQARWVV